MAPPPSLFGGDLGRGTPPTGEGAAVPPRTRHLPSPAAGGGTRPGREPPPHRLRRMGGPPPPPGLRGRIAGAATSPRATDPGAPPPQVGRPPETPGAGAPAPRRGRGGVARERGGREPGGRERIGDGRPPFWQAVFLKVRSIKKGTYYGVGF